MAETRAGRGRAWLGEEGRGGGRMQRAPALSVAWRRPSQPSARPSLFPRAVGSAPSSVISSVHHRPRLFRAPSASLFSALLSPDVDRPDHVDRRPPSVGRSRHSHDTSCLCLAANNSCSQGRWHPTRRPEGAHSARARARSSGRRGGATTRGGVQTSAVGGAGRGGDGRGVRARRCTSAPRAVLPLGARMACAAVIFIREHAFAGAGARGNSLRAQ